MKIFKRFNKNVKYEILTNNDKNINNINVNNEILTNNKLIKDIKLTNKKLNNKNYNCNLILWNGDIYFKNIIDEYEDLKECKNIRYVYLTKNINSCKFKSEYNKYSYKNKSFIDIIINYDIINKSKI